MPIPNKRTILGEKFPTSAKIQINAQVHLSAQLKLGANLKKMKRRVFVISFGKNFGSNVVIFVKDVPEQHFLLLLFFHFF